MSNSYNAISQSITINGAGRYPNFIKAQDFQHQMKLKKEMGYWSSSHSPQFANSGFGYQNGDNPSQLSFPDMAQNDFVSGKTTCPIGPLSPGGPFSHVN